MRKMMLTVLAVAFVSCASVSIGSEFETAFENYKQGLIALPAEVSAINPAKAAEILQPFTSSPEKGLEFLRGKLASSSVDDKGLAVEVIVGMMQMGKLNKGTTKEELLAIIKANDWSKATAKLKLPLHMERCKGYLEEN